MKRLIRWAKRDSRTREQSNPQNGATTTVAMDNLPPKPWLHPLDENLQPIQDQGEYKSLVRIAGFIQVINGEEKEKTSEQKVAEYRIMCDALAGHFDHWKYSAFVIGVLQRLQASKEISGEQQMALAELTEMLKANENLRLIPQHNLYPVLYSLRGVALAEIYPLVADSYEPIGLFKQDNPEPWFRCMVERYIERVQKYEILLDALIAPIVTDKSECGKLEDYRKDITNNLGKLDNCEEGKLIGLLNNFLAQMDMLINCDEFEKRKALYTYFDGSEKCIASFDDLRIKIARILEIKQQLESSWETLEEVAEELSDKVRSSERNFNTLKNDFAKDRATIIRERPREFFEDLIGYLQILSQEQYTALLALEFAPYVVDESFELTYEQAMPAYYVLGEDHMLNLAFNSGYVYDASRARKGVGSKERRGGKEKPKAYFGEVTTHASDELAKAEEESRQDEEVLSHVSLDISQEGLPRGLNSWFHNQVIRVNGLSQQIGQHADSILNSGLQYELDQLLYRIMVMYAKLPDVYQQQLAGYQVGEETIDVVIRNWFQRKLQQYNDMLSQEKPSRVTAKSFIREMADLYQVMVEGGVLYQEVGNIRVDGTPPVSQLLQPVLEKQKALNVVASYDSELGRNVAVGFSQVVRLHDAKKGPEKDPVGLRNLHGDRELGKKELKRIQGQIKSNQRDVLWKEKTHVTVNSTIIDRHSIYEQCVQALDSFKDNKAKIVEQVFMPLITERDRYLSEITADSTYAEQIMTKRQVRPVEDKIRIACGYLIECDPDFANCVLPGFNISLQDYVEPISNYMHVQCKQALSIYDGNIDQVVKSVFEPLLNVRDMLKEAQGLSLPHAERIEVEQMVKSVENKMHTAYGYLIEHNPGFADCAMPETNISLKDYMGSISQMSVS